MQVKHQDIGKALLVTEKWHRMVLDDQGLICSGGDQFLNSVTGERFANILMEECRDRFNRLATGAIGEGDTDIFVTINGASFEMTVVSLGNGCTVFYRDIESKLGSLERLSFFYRNFLNTPTGICITDEEGTIKDANRSFLDLYGYTLEEVLGGNPRILKSGRESPDTYQDMWQKITDPAVEKWSGEIINRKKNGEEVTVHLTISAVHNFSGQHMGFIATTIDMTSRKNIERDLEDCNQRLVEMNQLKSDMMAITSHDLKSPLNAIVSRASMLLDMAGDMPPAKQTDHLEKIVASGMKMATFIDDLLDLEKIEAGRFQLTTARMHLDSLLHSCVETNMPSAAEKNIMLEVQLHGDQDPVRADAMKLEQAVNNIISNAIKFTPQGGRIIVACTGRSGSEKLITISDNGPGIPERYIPLIFDRYYQAKNDGRAPGRVYGAGLGLSIVKNIVELHGGSVSAANRVEGGCEFAIKLPAKGKARSGQDIAALIVDPNQEIYSSIEPHLRHKGVSCYVARTLHEVTRVCRREQPELIFVAESSLNKVTKDYLAEYGKKALMVAVDGDLTEEGSFASYVTTPVMDVEIFEIIDELLLTDDGDGRECELHGSHC